MEPRYYQKEAIDQIIALLRKGVRRILLQMATGAGKTFIFCTILLGCLKKKNPCIMVVRGRSLVDQASKRLAEMGVPHGVYMGNDYDPKYLIQIVSIDTARSRQKFPPAKVVIIDEAHYATSDSFKDFLENYKDAVWISVTATPYPKGGLKHIAEEVVYPVSINKLFTDNFLCPPRYFAPNDLDMKGVKILGDDYNEAQALENFEKNKIYGHVTKHWERLCRDESSLCFAINLEHGANLVTNYATVGARAVLVDAKTPLQVRTKIIEDLETGKIDVIVNVGTMTTGVDIPSLQNIVFCRPTASKVLYTQMLGRGTRIFPGKKYFKVIDHVGNIKRHGFIEDEEKSNLEPKRKGRPGEIPVKSCSTCYAALPIQTKICPYCGAKFENERELEVVDSELKEIKPKKYEDDFQRTAYRLWRQCQKKQHQPGWVWHRLKGQFAEHDWPLCQKYYKEILSEAKRIGYNPPKKPAWNPTYLGFNAKGEAMEVRHGYREDWE